MTPQFTNPKAMAQAGEQIYDRQYRSDFEKDHNGKFAAVNIRTEKAYLGNGPDEAIENGRKADPSGIFHLIRIGFPGAFQISYALQNAGSDWLSQ